MESRIDSRGLIVRRIARGWSQEELAMASGLSALVIQRVESGVGASLETLEGLAAAFDVSLGELSSPSGREDRSVTSVRWGVGGLLLGYACAFGAVSYTLYTGQTSGWYAGVTLGSLGAVTGALCAAIGWFGRR